MTALLNVFGLTDIHVWERDCVMSRSNITVQKLHNTELNGIFLYKNQVGNYWYLITKEIREFFILKEHVSFHLVTCNFTGMQLLHPLSILHVVNVNRRIDNGCDEGVQHTACSFIIFSIKWRSLHQIILPKNDRQTMSSWC